MMIDRARGPLLLLLALAPQSATALDITSCGQTVPRRETGVLQVDLDCSASTYGVRLFGRATLDLNGHRIAGGDETVATVVGVQRASGVDPVGSGSGKFTIRGPGEITGTNHPPFTALGTDACVLLSNGRAQITSSTGVVDIHGCIIGIRGSTGNTPDGRARAQIDHVALHDSMMGGLSLRNLEASNVTVYDHPDAIGLGASRKMFVDNIVASNNSIGLFAGKILQGTNVTATGNWNGVDSCGFGLVNLTNLVATNNINFGACADRLRLTDSTVTDNTSADVYSITLPVLVNTGCGTSQGVDSTTASWGVCANDP